MQVGLLNLCAAVFLAACACFAQTVDTLAATAPRQPHSPTVEKLRYASWNLRWEDKKDIANGDAWEKRVQPIADIIRYNDFDIVGTQENSADHAADLMARLPNYDIVQIDSLEDNPILIKRGMFSLLDSGRFYFSQTPEVRSKSWDSRRIRFCTWVKLGRDKDTLFVFNVHFDYRGKDAQAESAKLMNKKILSIAGNAPFIFAGDLNFVDTSDSYKIIGSCIPMNDAKKVADFAYTPNGSFDYFDPQKFSKWQFDHIFTSPQVKVHRYGILNESYYDGEKFRYPSDHLPVAITFSLQK